MRDLLFLCFAVSTVSCVGPLKVLIWVTQYDTVLISPNGYKRDRTCDTLLKVQIWDRWFLTDSWSQIRTMTNIPSMASLSAVSPRPVSPLDEQILSHHFLCSLQFRTCSDVCVSATVMFLYKPTKYARVCVCIKVTFLNLCFTLRRVKHVLDCVGLVVYVWSYITLLNPETQSPNKTTFLWSFL